MSKCLKNWNLTTSLISQRSAKWLSNEQHIEQFFNTMDPMKRQLTQKLASFVRKESPNIDMEKDALKHG